MNPLLIQPPRIDRVPLHLKFHTTADVLRLDEVHPVVSGNKWYKLRYYLDAARQQNKQTLLSFGGAWSNHIVATAAAAQASGLRSIGLIRGEESKQYGQALRDARDMGMQLYFLSREDYRSKALPPDIDPSGLLIIPEGGGGPMGVAGAASILEQVDSRHYTHILTAVGTGTTLAGIARAAHPGQVTAGVMVLKGTGTLKEEAQAAAGKNMEWIEHYHFGGYAKKTQALIGFMNDWYRATGIPSDFVYTGKLFFAFRDLLERGYFPAGARVLLLHTSGLQGNRSLPKGTLIF